MADAARKDNLLPGLLSDYYEQFQAIAESILDQKVSAISDAQSFCPARLRGINEAIAKHAACNASSTTFPSHHSPSQALLLNILPAEPAFGQAVEAEIQMPNPQHVLVAHFSSPEPHSELLVHLW